MDLERILGVPVFESVKWVSTTKGADSISSAYTNVRQTRGLAILLAPIELFILSVILFVHQLPWPEWFLNMLYVIDSYIARMLQKSLDIFYNIFGDVKKFMGNLKQSIESIVDFTLSLTIFLSMKVIEFYVMVFNFGVKVMRIVFFPWYQIITYIMLKYNQQQPTAVESTSGSITISPTKEVPKSIETFTTKRASVDRGSRTSGIGSESESDHSTVSDCNLQAHTDQQGRFYKRIDVKVTPEGRLREELFKHVKSHLKVMRKNSIIISKGIASQAKNVLEPVISPLQKLIDLIKESRSLGNIWKVISEKIKENKYLMDLYEKIYGFISSNLARFNPTKKSKKRKSSRAESLHRRVPAIKSPQTPGLSGLLKSAEPTSKDDETPYNNINNDPKIVPALTINKTEDDDSQACSNGDSAIASSLDDINNASDSTPESPDPSGLKEENIDITMKETKNESEQEYRLRVDEKNIKNSETTDENTEDSPKGEKKSKKNVRYRV